MRNMHSHSQEVDTVSVFIGTWNMGLTCHEHFPSSVCHVCLFQAMLSHHMRLPHGWSVLGVGSLWIQFWLACLMISMHLALKRARSMRRNGWHDSRVLWMFLLELISNRLVGCMSYCHVGMHGVCGLCRLLRRLFGVSVWLFLWRRSISIRFHTCRHRQSRRA